MNRSAFDIWEGVEKPGDEVNWLDIDIEESLWYMIDIDSHTSNPAKKANKKCPSSHCKM